MGSVSDWEGSGRDCKSKDCTDVPAPAVDNLAAGAGLLCKAMPERGFLTLLRVAESTRTRLERKYISWYGGSARTGGVQDSLGCVVSKD